VRFMPCHCLFKVIVSAFSGCMLGSSTKCYSACTCGHACGYEHERVYGAQKLSGCDEQFGGSLLHDRATGSVLVALLPSTAWNPCSIVHGASRFKTTSAPCWHAGPAPKVLSLAWQASGRVATLA
jgi:hypothetical protein